MSDGRSKGILPRAEVFLLYADQTIDNFRHLYEVYGQKYTVEDKLKNLLLYPHHKVKFKDYQNEIRIFHYKAVRSFELWKITNEANVQQDVIYIGIDVETNKLVGYSLVEKKFVVIENKEYLFIGHDNVQIEKAVTLDIEQLDFEYTSRQVSKQSAEKDNEPSNMNPELVLIDQLNLGKSIDSALAAVKDFGEYNPILFTKKTIIEMSESKNFTLRDGYLDVLANHRKQPSFLQALLRGHLRLKNARRRNGVSGDFDEAVKFFNIAANESKNHPLITHAIIRDLQELLSENLLNLEKDLSIFKNENIDTKTYVELEYLSYSSLQFKFLKNIYETGEMEQAKNSLGDEWSRLVVAGNPHPVSRALTKIYNILHAKDNDPGKVRNELMEQVDEIVKFTRPKMFGFVSRAVLKEFDHAISNNPALDKGLLYVVKGLMLKKMEENNEKAIYESFKSAHEANSAEGSLRLAKTYMDGFHNDDHSPDDRAAFEIYQSLFNNKKFVLPTPGKLITDLKGKKPNNPKRLMRLYYQDLIKTNKFAFLDLFLKSSCAACKTVDIKDVRAVLTFKKTLEGRSIAFSDEYIDFLNRHLPNVIAKATPKEAFDLGLELHELFTEGKKENDPGYVETQNEKDFYNKTLELVYSKGKEKVLTLFVDMEKSNDSNSNFVILKEIRSKLKFQNDKFYARYMPLMGPQTSPGIIDYVIENESLKRNFNYVTAKGVDKKSTVYSDNKKMLTADKRTKLQEIYFQKYGLYKKLTSWNMKYVASSELGYINNIEKISNKEDFVGIEGKLAVIRYHLSAQTETSVKGTLNSIVNIAAIAMLPQYNGYFCSYLLALLGTAQSIMKQLPDYIAARKERLSIMRTLDCLVAIVKFQKHSVLLEPDEAKKQLSVFQNTPENLGLLSSFIKFYKERVPNSPLCMALVNLESTLTGKVEVSTNRNSVNQDRQNTPEQSTDNKTDTIVDEVRTGETKKEEIAERFYPDAPKFNEDVEKELQKVISDLKVPNISPIVPSNPEPVAEQPQRTPELSTSVSQTDGDAKIKTEISSEPKAKETELNLITEINLNPTAPDWANPEEERINSLLIANNTLEMRNEELEKRNAILEKERVALEPLKEAHKHQAMIKMQKTVRMFAAKKVVKKLRKEKLAGEIKLELERLRPEYNQRIKELADSREDSLIEVLSKAWQDKNVDGIKNILSLLRQEETEKQKDDRNDHSDFDVR